MKRITTVNCALTAIVWLAFAGAGRASGEGGIDLQFESVVLDASEAGYRFSVKMDKNDTLDLIEVEWAGKKSSFTKKDFGKVERAYIRGVRLIAPTSISGGKQDTVIMVIPYNKDLIESAENTRNQYQIDVVRLWFDHGSLISWQKAEAIAGRPGFWKYISKGDIISHVVDGIDKVDANGVYHDPEERSGKENPYARVSLYEDSP